MPRAWLLKCFLKWFALRGLSATNGEPALVIGQVLVSCPQKKAAEISGFSWTKS